MDSDALKALGDKAQALAKLEGNEGWQMLRRIAAEECEKTAALLAKTLLRDHRAVDQRAIDYERGYWAGVKWLLDNPERTQRRLEHRLEPEEEQ